MQNDRNSEPEEKPPLVENSEGFDIQKLSENYQDDQFAAFDKSPKNSEISSPPEIKVSIIEDNDYGERKTLHIKAGETSILVDPQFSPDGSLKPEDITKDQFDAILMTKVIQSDLQLENLGMVVDKSIKILTPFLSA